jgi:hypothetical protein
MTAEAIQAFLDVYAGAFVREDVDAVVACWRFPATVSTPEGDVVLDEPAFRRNTEALFGFYRGQGMTDVRGSLVQVDRVSPDLADVAVAYELFDDAGELIVSWRNGYRLREIDGAIHAISSVADAEVEAWAERGTPLGSSPEGSFG